MNTAAINQELTLSYPDSFALMSEEELQRYFSSAQNRWGAYDAERHMILSVSWTKAGFLSFLSDAETMLIGVEARFKRNLINYRRLAASKTKIAGKKGYAIRFEYRANEANIYHISEIRAIKYKKKYYAIQYIGRRITDDACRPDYEEAVKSIVLK